MAPQAQKAHWKPLVSAAAGAAPWGSRGVARGVGGGGAGGRGPSIASPDTAPPAKLLGGVDEPRGQAGLVLGDPGQGGDRDRDVGKCGADSDDEERPGQAGPQGAGP